MAKALIINNLIDSLGIKISPFESSIGVANGTLKGAIKRNADLTLNIIEKIIAKYPNVNKEWLITGEGPMFIDGTTQVAEPSVNYNTDASIKSMWNALNTLLANFITDKDLKELNDADQQAINAVKASGAALIKRLEEKKK